MSVYFMRHAEAVGNAENVWIGRKDAPLTAKGMEQLQHAAAKLSTLRIDCIFCSPLQRALETANAVAEAQTVRPELRVCEELQERDFGRYEGQLKSLENRQGMESDTSTESLEKIQQRLKPILEAACRLPGNVLLVSHSDIYKCIVETAGLTPCPPKTRLANAEVVTLLKHQPCPKS